MKFLFDLFPVLLFFIAFQWAGIYVATGVAMAATLGQILWQWFRRRKIDNMLWASLAIVGLFGGATLLLHDETFIKWKPTVLYWLFALVLGLAPLVAKKNLIRAALEGQVELPQRLWSGLNAAWVAFFVVMGLANLYVAFVWARDDTALWVKFKLFGGMGLMLVFVIGQSLFLAKYMEEKK